MPGRSALTDIVTSLTGLVSGLRDADAAWSGAIATGEFAMKNASILTASAVALALAVPAPAMAKKKQEDPKEKQ